MAQINQDRYETLAARALGVKGAGILGHAEDAIFATLDIDANSPVELWYPQRIYRYGLGVFVAGTPGARGGIQVRNTTTDQLWIIDRVNAANEVGPGQFRLWVGRDITTDFYPSALLATALDTRIPGSTVHDMGSQGSNALTIPPGHTQIDGSYCVRHSMCTWTPGVVLAPGGSFVANEGHANEENVYGITFHTRQAMPGELT